MDTVGDPVTGRDTDGDTLQGASWGEQFMCYGVRLPGFKPLFPTDQLYDFEQMNLSLCASVSSSVKGV